MSMVRTMAKPILPTPAVCGDDAKALLRSLEKPATRAQMSERIERAKRRLSATAGGAAVYTAALRPHGDRR